MPKGTQGQKRKAMPQGHFLLLETGVDLHQSAKGTNR
jgi:hypothetical protein